MDLEAVAKRLAWVLLWETRVFEPERHQRIVAGVQTPEDWWSRLTPDVREMRLQEARYVLEQAETPFIPA